jgi:tRNA threonylcarbamoyladenosine biosynthesis protein TsaE
MPPRGDVLPAVSRSPEETRTLGGLLARELMPRTVVALYGELGAGKTEFVRGACAALGIETADVSSPSFTIVNEYAGGRLPVYHFDAYRIKTSDEFFELGYEEYFGGDGICFVEWPERIESLLRGDVIRIRFEHVAPTERRISFVLEED